MLLISNTPIFLVILFTTLTDANIIKILLLFPKAFFLFLQSNISDEFYRYYYSASVGLVSDTGI